MNMFIWGSSFLLVAGYFKNAKSNNAGITANACLALPLTGGGLHVLSIEEKFRGFY